MASIVSLNISTAKGTEKQPQPSVTVQVDHGIVGDAHARDWHRQISLLGVESIAKMTASRTDLDDLKPGSFAENITTEGIDLPNLPIGSRLRIGTVELEVTQIGKKCHDKCNIYIKVGDCVMPREGIFAKVISPGVLKTHDEIAVLPPAANFL